MMKIRQYAVPASKLEYRSKARGIKYILAKLGTTDAWVKTGQPDANIDGCIARMPEYRTAEPIRVKDGKMSFMNDSTVTKDELFPVFGHLLGKDPAIKDGEYEAIEVFFHTQKLIFDFRSGDAFSCSAKHLPPCFVVDHCEVEKKNLMLHCVDVSDGQPFAMAGYGAAVLMITKRLGKTFATPRPAAEDRSRAVMKTTYGEVFAWGDEQMKKAEERLLALPEQNKPDEEDPQDE